MTTKLTAMEILNSLARIQNDFLKETHWMHRNRFMRNTTKEIIQVGKKLLPELDTVDAQLEAWSAGDHEQWAAKHVAWVTEILQGYAAEVRAVLTEPKRRHAGVATRMAQQLREDPNPVLDTPVLAS